MIKYNIIFCIQTIKFGYWMTMPDDFKGKYQSTRVIIDCTEVRYQKRSSLQLNGELFSSYKHHTTHKGLIGISPHGAVTF
jgi:hypothetical protein